MLEIYKYTTEEEKAMNHMAQVIVPHNTIITDGTIAQMKAIGEYYVRTPKGVDFPLYEIFEFCSKNIVINAVPMKEEDKCIFFNASKELTTITFMISEYNYTYASCIYDSGFGTVIEAMLAAWWNHRDPYKI